MEPNTPAPQPNQYDYILNPQTAPKRPTMLGGTGGNPIVKVVFVLVVLIIAFVGFSIFSNLNKKDYAPVLDLAQRQTEIVRIADLGLKTAHDPNTLTYVSTVRNITASENADTLALLKKKKFKYTTAKLALKKDTSTDKVLLTAEQNNTYDNVLLGKLNGLVIEYQKASRNVIPISNSISEKALFVTMSTNAKILDNVK